MKNQQRALTETQTYAYCTGNRHGRHIRVSTFNELGLLSWCKFCHCEVVVTWDKLDEIRRGFQQRLDQP
jgi:hypothetical protein